jgi:cation:H+ antiporter
MRSTDEELAPDSSFGRQQVSLALAVLVMAPGLVVRFAGHDLSSALQAAMYGASIVGAAFLLSWAAEAAQLDISAGLAIAVLAFIAVLPEYAVDLVFARKGGAAFRQFGRVCHGSGSPDASPCSLALANMTGSNRLLIGVGWALVVFIAWWRWRSRGARRSGVTLERSHSVELAYLTIACVYALTLPLKRSITLVDSAVLIAVFVLYTVRVSRAPAEEPDLVGPARWIGSMPTRHRRATVLLLFVMAAAVIALVAEHFAASLVDTGRTFGISEFLLVQWLAPLASESPELLVAGLYAWRLNTSAGLGTLVSSKVNQWTLLVGTLPIAFAISAHSWHGLPIVATQREELLLTAAQSVFALATLCNLNISNREASMLFGLFWAQFVLGAAVPSSMHGSERLIVSAVYMIGAAWLLLRSGGAMRRLLHDGFRVPYSELAESSGPDQ